MIKTYKPRGIWIAGPVMEILALTVLELWFFFEIQKGITIVSSLSNHEWQKKGIFKEAYKERLSKSSRK